jgi:hypothetical protein
LVLRLELDPGGGRAGQIRPVVLRGVAAGTPIAPPLTRNAKVWELSLARIRVSAGTLAVTSADITDERFDTQLCGLINSVLGLDSSAWQAQFDAFMSARAAIANTQENAFATGNAAIQTQARDAFAAALSQHQSVWKAWFAGIKVDLHRYANFNFDNLPPGVERQTARNGNNGTISTIRTTGTGLLVATRSHTRNADDSATAVTRLFDIDGATILIETTNTIRRNADGSVTETTTGFDNIGLHSSDGIAGTAEEIWYRNAGHPSITNAAQALDLALLAVKELGWT